MKTATLHKAKSAAAPKTRDWIYLPLTVFITAAIGVFGMAVTKANFSDFEGLANNLFAMGNLHFNISSAADFTPQDQCEAKPTREITITNQGNPFRYKITAANVSGGLCPYLTLQASLDGVPVCSGNLDDFECNNQVFSQISPAPSQVWTFTATYAANAPANSACAFDFAYSSWQIALSEGGFTDRQTISNTITRGACGPKTPMIINKLYYDVASGKGNDPDNEWIEIYNPNDVAVNLKNWQICNQAFCETIKNDSLIPPKGYAVVSLKAATWSYWTIPAEVLKIDQFVESPPSVALNNDNGMVILKDSDGKIVDQMNYGTPSLAWPMYNGDVWDPGVADGGRGHALGRYPAGIDTDTKDDWKDYALPSITITSVGTTGMYIYGQTYAISWSASNPSGSDDNLLVDLYYIMDTNSNNTYDSGDQVTTIAADLQHTGTYNLTITGTYHYFGYVWIKAVVKNTDNFMITGLTRSRGIFEPDTEDVVPPVLIEDILEDLGGGGYNTSSDATSTDPFLGNATTTGDMTYPAIPPIDNGNATTTLPILDITATEEQLNATTTIQSNLSNTPNPALTNSLTLKNDLSAIAGLVLPIFKPAETATSTAAIADEPPSPE